MTQLAWALSFSWRGEVQILEALLGILTWSTVVVGLAVAPKGLLTGCQFMKFPGLPKKKEKKN